MAKLLSLGVGYSDARNMVQPSLNDCLVAVIEYAELLMEEVIDGLVLAQQPTAARPQPALQDAGVKRAIIQLRRKSDEVCADFRGELSRIVYEGGADPAPEASPLRFEHLQLFETADLDRSIELARAQNEMLIAVEDVLPPLDACVSTLLGWRTIQPELNPLRPDVFVRALQAVLSWHVPAEKAREALITPAAGLLGANVRKIYRELSDWLRNAGVEPAVPSGGIVGRAGALKTARAQESDSRTLLTLDRLRQLMTGGFDGAVPKVPRSDFLHTVPASMALLQKLSHVDRFVERLRERAHWRAEAKGGGRGRKPALQALFARQLGEEVVRQMFEHLAQDARLLPGYQARLCRIEPAVIKLAWNDSRFFSDPQHPARRLLDQLTQRSLGFQTEDDEGCDRFLASAETAVRWLEADTIDAEVFSELLDYLQCEWARDDQQLHAQRDQEAQRLLQTERHDQLVEQYAAEFLQACRRREVPEFVSQLLRRTWPRVVAQARLEAPDSVEDPGGYRALARELIWSVQTKKEVRPARTRRLAATIPSLLARLRSGLAHIGHPPALTERFLDQLITVHQAALKEGREAAAQAGRAALAGQQEALASAQDDTADSLADSGPAPLEALAAEPARPGPPPAAGSADPATAAGDAGDSIDALAAQWLADQDTLDARYPAAPEEKPATALAPGGGPPVSGELQPGTWVDLRVGGRWLRVQLTWASPGATLFMFISPAGTAHSMSRRTLERLRGQGSMRVVADRSPVQEALDGVAKVALVNTLATRA